jgi:hypothetical protein
MDAYHDKKGTSSSAKSSNSFNELGNSDKQRHKKEIVIEEDDEDNSDER